MTIESIQYWDVFPKIIRVSKSGFAQYIPLSIRGEIASPVFETSNPDIAAVDEAGNVMCGFQPGAAMIMVWDSPERASLRHVQVEVYGTLASPSDPPEEPEVPY
jgi:hypothetical protein